MPVRNRQFICKASKLVYIFCTSLLLLSCNIGDRDMDRTRDIIDPDLGYTREDYRDKLTPKNTEQKKEKEKTSAAEPSIPELSEILTAPRTAEVLPDKLVSLSVTEDVPLKDVLIELSRLADVDMEVDPSITGGIIMRVKDKPFKDVIERVVELGGLRYYTKNGVMRVERDTPYQVNYKVDFLNMIRQSTSSINIDSQALSSAGSTTGGLTAGSSSSISATSDGNVWESIEKTITSLLSFTQNSNLGGSSFSQADSNASSATDRLQMNQNAGIISVIATQRQHKTIEEYLKEVKKQISAQVLIEAKVVEVTLDESYKSGINWGQLRDLSLGLSFETTFTGGISDSVDFFKLSGDSGGDLSTAVSLTEAFGVSRTLSSPRLNAMNNQQALLTFTENNVYFTLDVQEETDTADGGGSTTRLTIESTLNTVPIGVILALQPSINLDSQEITMHVRPTLSRITGTVNDPGVDATVARNAPGSGIKSAIPIIEVRELDSILKIKSGDIMVIGGLMKDVKESDDAGVPFVNRAPIIGNLFKSKVQNSAIVETVIFIKATIVPGHNSVSKGDQDVYKNFIKNDPRPLAF